MKRDKLLLVGCLLMVAGIALCVRYLAGEPQAVWIVGLFR